VRQIWAIALNTFREAIRNKVFASLILFAVALMMFTLAISSASLHEEERLVKDMGLFLTSTFSVLIAVFVGVNLVYKEIERKTIFTIVPKPIFRFQFLLGKALGLALTMLVQVTFMGLVLFGQFVLLEARFGFEMIQALFLVYVEVLTIVGIALLFSSFSTPFLSGMLTLGVFVVGRFVDRLSDLHLRNDDGVELPPLRVFSAIIRGVASVVPDLSLYNTTTYVVYDQALDWHYVIQATLYGLTYLALCLVAASVLFSRRDFT
jgi:ABC-type transport system involved in multi-copper enzyme maturation permease subunit